jgi:hypothetical protein
LNHINGDAKPCITNNNQRQWWRSNLIKLTAFPPTREWRWWSLNAYKMSSFTNSF